ncbi:hypothetical protein SAMN05518855_1008151 [Paenibacillus sp. CF384]|nr:hypothetical protein SAMN05518855_1008151 [Paenibacillus sp. CF384]
MKLRIPLYLAATCLISIFADRYVLNWVGSADVKSIIFGLLVGVAFLVLEKSRLAGKCVSIPSGIVIIMLSLVVRLLSNHYYL